MGHSSSVLPSWRQATVTVRGIPVGALIDQHREELVEAMVRRLRTDLTSYAGLTATEPDDLVITTCHRFIDYYVDAFRRHELPSHDSLGPVRRTAERRATSGVPMEDVMTAFHLGAAVVTEEVARLAGAGDSAAVIAVQSFGFELARLVALAVATGYTTERQSILGEELAARQTLVADLLAGTATDESALRAGIRLPAAYIVVAFSVGEHAGAEEDVVVRRAIRRVRDELTRIVDEPVLWASPRAGWLALMPHPGGSDRPSIEDRVSLAMTHRQLQTAVELPIYSGWADAAPPAVPEAARLARDVCDVVLATRRPPGIYELDDVLIDYQLMRPSPARDRLGELLQPLASRPELLTTLRTYLGTGKDRRRTAQLLHLHPNSVDNRLRRCADVSGLDATDAEEAIVIRAALLASHVSGPPVASRAGQPDVPSLTDQPKPRAHLS